ncbi:SDR family oxidoreductase [Paenibacillus sedimenti]|uniref:SDR family oxidoreductase n=1 Tax=Paenibacillus sedimenti TaxID=2770274 RepID=UPI00289746BC|nr:SDR family oxidoreductase [Paenibacillus sedimenti]
MPGDLRDPAASLAAIASTMNCFGRLDVLVNNASIQYCTKSILDVSDEQLENTFRTNVFPLFYMTKGVRVNAVAPGPTRTSLTASSCPAEQVPSLGTNVPMGRAGQPFEIAPAFVYLAAKDSVYVTGQVIHVNGGKSLYS